MLGHQCSVLRSRGLCWWQSTNPKCFLLGTHAVHKAGKVEDSSDTSKAEVAENLEGEGMPGIASSGTGTASDNGNKEAAAVKEKQTDTNLSRRWRMVVRSCYCAITEDTQYPKVCNTAREEERTGHNRSPRVVVLSRSLMNGARPQLCARSCTASLKSYDMSLRDSVLAGMVIRSRERLACSAGCKGPVGHQQAGWQGPSSIRRTANVGTHCTSLAANGHKRQRPCTTLQNRCAAKGGGSTDRVCELPTKCRDIHEGLEELCSQEFFR